MGISWPQLLIIAVIVILLFGTKKLGSIGSDLGTSIKDFKKAIKDDAEDTSTKYTDFTTKSIADNTESTEKSKAKCDYKEQV